MPAMQLRSRCEADTERLGEVVGRLLARGSVLGLVGPLGAGKTAFVRGVARACGVEEGLVHSPTFVTATQYPGAIPVAHLDLYRHEGASLDRDWLAELLDSDEGVTLIEWFERLGGAPLSDGLLVRIEYADRDASCESDDERVLSIEEMGPRGTSVLDQLRRQVSG